MRPSLRPRRPSGQALSRRRAERRPEFRVQRRLVVHPHRHPPARDAPARRLLREGLRALPAKRLAALLPGLLGLLGEHHRLRYGFTGHVGVWNGFGVPAGFRAGTGSTTGAGTGGPFGPQSTTTPSGVDFGSPGGPRHGVTGTCARDTPGATGPTAPSGANWTVSAVPWCETTVPLVGTTARPPRPPPAGQTGPSRPPPGASPPSRSAPPPPAPRPRPGPRSPASPPETRRY